MEKTETMIMKIVTIPKLFYSNENNKSFYTLLEETGYLGTYTEIFKKDILFGLQKAPECIDYWISWSENKRDSGGWYIRKEGGQFVVDEITSEAMSKKQKFTDLLEACSCFILEEIRTIKKRG